MTVNQAYQLLDIPFNSSVEIIKEAYRKQAKKYHPDLYQGDKKFAVEKMKQINEAYDLLSKPHASTPNTSSSNNSTTSYDYHSEQEAQRRAEAQRKYKEDMQKKREEYERIAKEFEEYQKQKDLEAKRKRQIAQPFLIVLFFMLEVYLVKLFILAINSIKLYFWEANWVFFVCWIIMGILATALNIGIPVVMIWLFKKTQIFKRKK